MRIVASIDGLPKAGKTRLALTFPTPMVIMDFNQGVDAHIPWLESQGKRVVKSHASSPVPPLQPNDVVIIPLVYDALEPDVPSMRRLLDQFKARYTDALRNLLAAGGAGTIVIDTGTELWGLVGTVKSAEAAGPGKEVQPRHYGEANKLFEMIFKQALALGPNLNLAITHWMSPEWGMVEDDKGRSKLGLTGELKLDSQKNIPALVELQLEVRHDPKRGNTPSRHVARVLASRANSGRVGMELATGGLMEPTYDSLVKLLYPGPVGGAIKEG